ncbi:tRNA (guanosine(37)-N1)-methyltransferase TrmD [Candidatus Shapirobacteria bacterium CG_4_8_14_3_um_filter_35_11]|uniref:tRNA (guanine-N(1)-)-methyltransferase n=2 Tax=Candidatus Shapironibacteriota TaxID=1752721 RepID=A0A2M8GII9_9BACT|nr:MAG: tRNA (guanosine(37)-N1)-methyltransferase TrmD [Candidatus Shapirobacteria bacterium CG_4_8_14_3_um_filter_35_11]
MKFDIVTLFPKMFEGVFGESMIKRAVDKKLIEIKTHDMRQWAWNNYGAVDDKPYGGGVGMLIRVDVIAKAITDITNFQKTNLQFPNKSQIINNNLQREKTRIVLTSARGKKFTQRDAERLGKYDNLIIICGHYEGFDERISELVDEEISIGDYVLTGGEIPAMTIIDSVTRLLPGVLGKYVSSKDESHSSDGYIEYPQYTRPEVYDGKKVPEVLLSGDPKKILEFQNKKAN